VSSENSKIAHETSSKVGTVSDSIRSVGPERVRELLLRKKKRNQCKEEQGRGDRKTGTSPIKQAPLGRLKTKGRGRGTCLSFVKNVTHFDEIQGTRLGFKERAIKKKEEGKGISKGLRKKREESAKCVPANRGGMDDDRQKKRLALGNAPKP